MKKWIVGCLMALGVVTHAAAAGGGFPLDKAPQRTNDMEALQNGARLFVNYCLSCHSASFMRYNRLTEIGLTERQIRDNLMFTTEKVGDTMKAAINPVQAKEWFGANPPDLTLIARSRATIGGPSGADYLYTLLRTYYRDDTKITGWDNLVFPSIGMPHPLWQLQGERRPVLETTMSHGKEIQVLRGWEQVTPGTMSTVQYDQAVADLVAFLEWMGEPVQNTRVRIGAWVMLFLGLFTIVAWRLNAAYWKDIK
jgi:ubiquinol-cytochrome c reductase cytochrome c1 subunit